MVRINKVYTRTGDEGDTGLVGGRRVAKEHPRIEAYGTVDELNSVIGLCRSFLAQKKRSKHRDKLDLILESTQQRLFDIGSELATLPGDEYEGQVKVPTEDTHWMEEVIDLMNDDLDPLKSFILPGGTPLNAFLHQARTVCRRTERSVLRLHRDEEVSSEIRTFLNRLSDFLFVCGRWVTVTLGEEEVLWVPGKELPDWRWR
tara:strand:- start:1614 stop:2219 length:606 start_codon:yes stop_codon:yes gene_type:complete